MRYRQITPDERYTLGVLRKQGFSKAAMARALGRHRSTIGREFRRNASRFDGYYRSALVQEKTNGRRVRSRRNTQFSAPEWSLVERLLSEKFSPEQISGWLVATQQAAHPCYEQRHEYPADYFCGDEAGLRGGQKDS